MGTRGERLDDVEPQRAGHTLMLEVRGVSVDAASEARIRSCESLSTLQRWAQAAREASGAAALFG